MISNKLQPHSAALPSITAPSSILADAAPTFAEVTPISGRGLPYVDYNKPQPHSMTKTTTTALSTIFADVASNHCGLGFIDVALPSHLAAGSPMMPAAQQIESCAVGSSDNRLEERACFVTTQPPCALHTTRGQSYCRQDALPHTVHIWLRWWASTVLKPTCTGIAALDAAVGPMVHQHSGAAW